MNRILLSTDCLSKSFKGQLAVNKVSLNVRENTVYGLLGLNGAGKSTLLKMVVKILKPTEGKIFFDGHTLARADLLNIGSIIEIPAIYENLTAYENLKVHTTLLSIDQKGIPEVLKIVGLLDVGKKVASKFSLGMKQRLGIAIALISNPKLLILDEPTNGLDPRGIKELRELIRSFPKKGVTVILSSHILAEVSQIADNIGIINNGVLVYEGENDNNENLEKLFMDTVIKDSGGGKECFLT